MSRKYKIRDQSQLYFVTLTVVYWIDVFIRPAYINILIKSIKHCQENKGLEIYAYCFMTSHIHLIIGSNGTMPIELSSNQLMDQRLEYIHMNPVKAGFVESPEMWNYSSPKDYAGTGKIEIDIIFIE